MTHDDKTQPDNHFLLWTVKDLSFLENNYGTMPVAELAAILTRAPGAVGLMADSDSNGYHAGLSAAQEKLERFETGLLFSWE